MRTAGFYKPLYYIKEPFLSKRATANYWDAEPVLNI